MSLFTLISNNRRIEQQLSRIADALDRLAPLAGTEETKPTELSDVSYASDESSARQELIDQALRAGYRWIDGELVEPEETEADV